MKAGILGGSSQQRSLKQDAQRTVNLFALKDPDGIDAAALYSRPGNVLFGVAGTGAGRGALTAQNGRVFVVSGGSLFELKGDGSTTNLGNLQGNVGIVTMADNGFQLAICDGQSLYILKYIDDSFQKVNSPNLPSAASVAYIDGYFIINVALNSGIFRISAPFDGLTWNALDFATAESSPDALYRVQNVLGQLYLFGTISTEIWTNTGAAAFPFQRINNSAKVEIGTGSPYSVITLDNTVFWVGQDTNGYGIVYRADGFSPVRISTNPMERKIQNAPDKLDIRAIAYQEEGSTFLIITGGGMETAVVYDIANGIWTEWAYLNDSGNYELPLTNYLFYAFGKTLGLDRRSGNIYHQSLDYYSDNGEEIARDRIFTHIFDENKPFRINNLTINFETGVGDNETPDPKCILYLSRDGGQSWFMSYLGSLGRIGKFTQRVIFWRLGRFRQCTFRVRVTDKVKVAIMGAQFNA